MIKHWLFLLVSTIYLMNFTMGVWELPDNLPIVGNLDEFAASALWIHSAQAIRAKRRLKTDPPKSATGEPPAKS